MFKRCISLVAITALVFGAVPSHAQQQPVQWRYSFDSNGVATATYPGNTVVNGKQTVNDNINLAEDITIAEVDPGWPFVQKQSEAVFRAFKTIKPGVPSSVFQAYTLNGSLAPSTYANFVGNFNGDTTGFQSWNFRGGSGTNEIVGANFGSWIENNTALTWATEIDCNNEGSTMPIGDDRGCVGITLNTGSTFSPDTAMRIRRATGAGTGPGWSQGIAIEGARNIGIRIMAMAPATFPGMTPAAPGNITALAFGLSSDAQYRFITDANGIMTWGPGGVGAGDVSLFRTTVNTLAVSGRFQPFIIRPAPVTFANIGTINPTPQTGDQMFITDAATCTFNAVVTGGGAVPCPIFFDGSNWKAG